MAHLIKLLAAVCVVASGTARAEIADLTGDIWSVCGLDGRSTWHDTRLTFTGQTSATDGPVGHGNELTGYFDWRSSNGSAGREYFSGIGMPDGALSLQGMQMVDNQNLTTSRYNATVDPDGNTNLDGVWLDGIPGIWAAVRDGGRGTAVALCSPSDSLS